MRRSFLFLSCLLIAPQFARAAPTFLDDEAEPACNVSFALQKEAKGQFSLLFDQQDAQNSYVLDANSTSASFFLLQKGQRKLLSTAPVAWKTNSLVTIQRRPFSMRLIVDDRVVLTAFDATFQSGKIGAQSGGWGWTNPKVQPVEPIRFDDDFTRTGDEGDGGWTALQGQWRLSASSSSVRQSNADMSSNPFAYVAQASLGASSDAASVNKTGVAMKGTDAILSVQNAPTARAFSSAGRKFWDNYDARIAARPKSSGTIGIAAYVQDSKNYLAFLWDGTDGKAARRLVRVQNGVATTLAQAAGAYLPRQWTEIGIRTSPGEVEALIDGTSVLRARDDSFGQGSVGLIAQNLDSVAFDDLKVRSFDALNSDLTSKNGAWTSNGPFRLTGRPDENDFRLNVTLQNGGKDGFGLVSGFQDERNYALFRAAPANSSATFRGRQQIARVVNGAEKILSDAPLSLDLSGHPRLSLRAQNGAMTVSLADENGEIADETIVAQAAQSGLTRGRTGVWNATNFAPETSFLLPPAPDPLKVADRMEGDNYMASWASPSGEWVPQAGRAGLEFWNTGEFFGASSLEFPWASSYRGTLEIALGAARGQFISGLVLRAEAAADGKAVTWTLGRADTILGSAVVPIPATLAQDEVNRPFTIKVQMQGQNVLLFAGDAPVLSAFDAATPTGSSMALRASGFRIRADRLRAISQNRDDNTFTGAPTDFYSPQGTWSIFARWPCYGDWSFFGGQGLNPVLWSKRTYGGDIVAEMYAHPQMILPKEPGYAHPGDLNISLCGDGKNPASGYSFVLAGWDNTRSKLLRGSQVLAENRGDEGFFHETFNQNMQWHRRWFYIRAAAVRGVRDGVAGLQLTLTLDGRRILSAFDPNPLPNWNSGGRVAFWTVDSTLMIARAKIEAEHPGHRTLPTGLLDAPPPPSTFPLTAALEPFPTVVNDAATSLISRDATGYEVQNPVSGGTFEARLNHAPLDATPQTRFSLDAQIPAGTKIDAYIVIDGDRFTLEMTGAQKPDPRAPSLGAMTKVALPGDSNATWSFDLGAALAKRFPGQTSWKIESLSLGARHGDDYRYLGFDGNSLGARYHLANLRWN